MNFAFEEKWYKTLIKKYQYINKELVYETSKDNRILLSDIFVDHEIVQSASYIVGRSSEVDKNIKNTVDSLLSSPETNKNIVIGPLGSGKTSLLNHLVVSITKHKISGKQTDDTVVNAYRNKFVAYFNLKADASKESLLIKPDFDICIKAEIEPKLNKIEKRDLIDNYDNATAKGILLVIDGLDEINNEDRKKLVLKLERFCENPDNAVIASIRKEVLVEDSLSDSIRDFQRIVLAEFSPDKIDRFVNKWGDVCTQKGNKTFDAKKICKTIHCSPYLSELAANPLFLTLMLLITEKEGHFPNSRTKVYEEAVKLILERWNDRKKVNEKDRSEIRRALELAAFNAESSLNDYTHNSGSVSAHIIDAFVTIFPKDQPKDLLKELSEKVGFIQVIDNKYAFALQSFMEYFAGCYLSKTQDEYRFIQKHKENLLPWKEVVVFSVTHTAINFMSQAKGTLFSIFKFDPSSKDDIEPEIIMISGIIIHELLLFNPADNDLIILKERIKKWLKKHVHNQKISYRLRFTLGDVLSKLGDDRPGVGNSIINNKEYPEIVWLHIPEGVSSFGSPEGCINLVHECRLSEYWISQYPITNEQYRLFVEHGYENKSYWTDEGWAWLNGNNDEHYSLDKEGRYSTERKEEYRNWLDNRQKNKRKAPFWWQVHPWGISNRPVVGVTWYEAVAFCRWMNEECREQFITADIPIEMIYDLEASLPTLEEWEKAARGPNSTKYPWGRNLNEKRIRANCNSSQINETSPVGIFEEGKSKYKLYDMAGNVYEWISTGVTQVSDDKWVRENENLEGRYERLVKGGSWNMGYERSKAAYDEWDYPFIFDQNTGFRPILRIKGTNNDYGISKI